MGVYNGLFINNIMQYEVIDPEIIANISYFVMDQSIAIGKMLNTDYLQIEFVFLSGCYLYGTNHGPTGLIHQFLQGYFLYPDRFNKIMQDAVYYNAIKNTLDYYISIQLADGNMPTQLDGTCYERYGNDSDARVQFCHGAPGFINVYMDAVIAFSKFNTSAAVKYFETAYSVANVTWNRGLLAKGTMFCHGIGGNINQLWQFGFLINALQQNGDKAFLEELDSAGYDLEYIKNQSVWRAKQQVLWTLDWKNLNGTRIFDSDAGYSMYAGNYAIGPMLYAQLLNETSFPFGEGACQAGWNLCL